MIELLKAAIDVVHEDGTFSHGQNVEDCKDEILKQIGEEIDDRVIRIEIKKRPMQNASVCEKITGVASKSQNYK